MAVDHRIGFPAPLLGEAHHRLQVFYCDSEVLVLEKPLDVIGERHPWYPQSPSLISGLYEQLELDKPELQRFNVVHPQPVYNLEPEITGAIMLGLTKPASDLYRNLYGSRQIHFSFLLIAEYVGGLPDSGVCRLPVARHANAGCAVISSRTGKQSETQFRLLERFGKFALWEAKTNYLRMHQIRIHAHEMGIPVLGESQYSTVGVPDRNRLQGYRNQANLHDKALYPGICIHLVRLQWERKEIYHDVNIHPPKKWQVLCKQLRNQR